MLGLLFFGCSDEQSPAQENTAAEPTENPMDRLPDNEAGDAIRQAIAHAGGWEAWADKKTFTFYKNIEYFDSTGAKERSLRQLHQYQLQPTFKARLSWEENRNEYVIINNGQQAWKFKNGEEMTDQASRNQAWNSSFGSHYVIAMPFKLTDPGVILTDEGLDTIRNDQIVRSIKVEYEEGAGSSGGMHDWWYYFDPDNYGMAANFLDYGDGCTFTSYQTFTTVGGIRMHEKRHSYGATKEKEIQYLRTVYTNEEMQFDLPMKDELFEPLNAM